MNTIVNFIERKFLPVAVVIGSQKHLLALRDAFINLMPLTMAGSMAVLLNALLRDIPNTYLGTGNGVTTFPLVSWIISLNGIVWGGTLAVMGIMLSITLGYTIAKSYDVNKVAGAIVSLAAYLMGLPQSASTSTTLTLSEVLPANIADMIQASGATIATADGVSTITVTGSAWGFFNFSGYFGATGMFTVILFSFLSVIIFAKLMKKNITIKLPESVPPAVSRAFSAIIPGVISLYGSAIIYFVLKQSWALGTQPVSDWITEHIQQPLLGISQGYGSVFIIVLLVHLLWFFGLHGTNIMGAVLNSTYGVAQLQNLAAYESGAEIPYKWVSGSFEAFVWPGGAGVTIALIVSILILSKRADYKMVGKLGLGPGLFNINEPIMFGIPVVLNPLLIVPFILAPLATATISYFATIWGLVSPVVISVPWVMPVFLSGFLATAGDWRSLVLTAVNMAVAFAIWAPFIIAANGVDSPSDN
ncbi:PTS sugar transporter subunit IIC [Lacrimispora sp.]|uniref:PTS sugar transporter subunit IIC n=1 Tax=Lacrimispora sp. TaxID=2719234 RepID=UPI0028AD1F27|nr:PTS sugar transporter subunit IIC [Lacrimispora sp.]